MKILYSTWFVNHLPATRFALFWSDLHGYEHRTTTVLLQWRQRRGHNERKGDLSPVLEQERIGRRLLGSGVLVAHKSRPTRGKKKSRRRSKSA